MKALALLSGGLDSIIAIKLLQNAGVEVEGLHFLIPFHQSIEISAKNARNAARQLGIKLHFREFGSDYLRIIENPTYNYGKNMNPCIDCRIHQLNTAKTVMSETGASFLISGEVLDQRPHSQRRDALDIVERDSGLRGYILRPLSARHLRPTIPETEGWVDRTKLMDIKGRGRRQQMDLATKFGLTEYPAPGGGCLLTYKEYGLKLQDLIEHGQKLTQRGIELLRYGRHLRLSPNVKIIIGKNHNENQKLTEFAGPGDILLELLDFQGPTTLYLGPLEPDLLTLASAITAGFSVAAAEPQVRVASSKDGVTSEIICAPLPRTDCSPYYIYQF